MADRKLYTCATGVTCTASTVLDSSADTMFRSDNAHVTAADLGIAGNASDADTVAARSDLIAWVRGLDNTSPPERAAGGVRPSIPGDVLHSRPVVVNYNRHSTGCDDSTNNDTDVVTYYAANDGMIHALKGGLDAVTGAGDELWGFVPMEGFSQLKRLRDNTPAITLPSPVPAGDHNKPYFIDGNLTIYAFDANENCKLETGTDRVYLFATARRGGRFIYAFDVTDPNDPRYLWKKDSSSEGFSELGQTWSELKPTVISRTEGGELTRVPAVVFGAGYDPAAEDRPYNTSTGTYGGAADASSTMGRGVFVLEAASGNIIRRFGPAEADGGMTHSVPSAVTVLTDRDGVALFGYVGDTGGNLWRIDFRGEPATWTITKFAELSANGAQGRKFLYPPDVVAFEEGGYAVLLGSGDREHPFDTTTRNRFYMVKHAAGVTFPVRCTGTVGEMCDLFDATTSSTVPTDAKGWYIDLATGEKVVGGAVTLAGTTFFPTNEWTPPAPGSCTGDLGIARIYGISYLNASATMYLNTGSDELSRSMEVPGGGFPPSPVPTLIEIDNEFYQGVISGPTVVTPPGLTLDKRNLIYWYRHGTD
jgi:type IV pilus assembly protein PilY1